ncbi:MAG: protein-L-isoaspartate(D-aspartate) O-methyltransferase [Aestuariivirgaceae bacterium]|nr:protein-L-isoaspartate(D-aspartate) O-methyltransferase [Aestuariivirgaceae bacterium]
MSVENHKAQLVMSLRQQGVTDARVLEALEKIPRDLFVPEIFADQSWTDRALPISCGQTISQPTIVGIMTDRLEVGPRHKVLEIGTGSGYQTAVLSRLCRRVYTIERYRTLLEGAEERFRQLRLSNITSMVGDGYKGWPAQAPFDRIIVTAAPKEAPQALLEQLAEGGIMVIPLDHGRDGQELVRITRTAQGYERENLLAVRFVPLVEGLPRE